MNPMVKSGGARLVALTAIGLVIAIGVPELNLGKRLAPGGDLASLLIHEAVWWALVAVVLAYVLAIERRPLSSLGIKTPTWKTFVYAVPVGILVVAIILVSYTAIFPALGLKVNAGAMAKIMATPLWHRFLLVTRAAVAEEIIFRAYPIERVTGLTGSRAAGVAFSVAAFTLAHLSYWGWAQLIPVAGGGLVFALFYLWRRDVVSNMIAHFIADGSGFLLG
ncbi:MAG: CPBP family intramembrane metalloprotease [Pseudomonadota bacterium]|nr:CPBP family intramembrane metalloprotease [Pseudomonadota bacterium]